MLMIYSLSYLADLDYSLRHNKRVSSLTVFSDSQFFMYR